MPFEWNINKHQFSNWNHGGISCDVHFVGHLWSNRTNVVREEIHTKYAERGGGGLGWETLQYIVKYNLKQKYLKTFKVYFLYYNK